MEDEQRGAYARYIALLRLENERKARILDAQIRSRRHKLSSPVGKARTH